jgi:hypothetical protein
MLFDDICIVIKGKSLLQTATVEMIAVFLPFILISKEDEQSLNSDIILDTDLPLGRSTLRAVAGGSQHQRG